jgi:hypothetical protein
MQDHIALFLLYIFSPVMHLILFLFGDPNIKELTPEEIEEYNNMIRHIINANTGSAEFVPIKITI